jgi:hypothetical protein
LTRSDEHRVELTPQSANLFVDLHSSFFIRAAFLKQPCNGPATGICNLVSTG